MDVPASKCNRKRAIRGGFNVVPRLFRMCISIRLWTGMYRLTARDACADEPNTTFHYFGRFILLCSKTNFAACSDCVVLLTGGRMSYAVSVDTV